MDDDEVDSGPEDAGQAAGAESAVARPTLQLDKKTELGFCAFFRSMPEDFYTAHGEDAHFVAQTVFKTSTVIKYLGGDAGSGVAGCALSRMQTMSLLRDLLVHQQYRVEIWAQDGRAGASWKVKQKGSPGNLQDFEEMLFSSADITIDPVVLAIRVANNAVGDKVLGAAYADATSRRLGVCELGSAELQANLELGVRECLVPDDPDSVELKRAQALLEQAGVVVTVQKKGNFTIKNIEQDLARLLSDDKPVPSLPEFESKVALSALAALITYLELLADERNFRQFRLRTVDLSRFMKLDGSAVKALSLMPTAGDAQRKNMSLFGLLNTCRTAQGTRLLAQWLQQPLLDVAEIEARQDIVEAFTQATELRQVLQDDHLKRIPDLSRLAKRFQRGLGTLQDVVRLYQVVLRLPALVTALEQHGTSDVLHSAYTSALKRTASEMVKFQQMVETTVDLEAVTKHEFRIRANFDDRLQDLERQMKAIEKKLHKLYEQVARDVGLEAGKKLKLESSSQYGYYLRIARTDSAKIRNKREYMELSTQKQGIFFTTSAFKALSDSYTELHSLYDKKQAELVKEVIAIVGTAFPHAQGTGLGRY